MKAFTAILAVALLLAFAGCGGNDAATGSDEKDAVPATVSGATNTAPEAAPEKKEEVDSALAFKPREPRFPSPAASDDPHFPTITYKGNGPRAMPVVEPPDLPPPQRFVVRDIEVGTGPVAHHGDEVDIWFIDFFYKSGKQAFFGWAPPASPWTIDRVGAGGTFVAMEEGIEGMREGGRREMLVPARRAFGTGALHVMVDLVRVKPREPSRGG